MKKIIALAVLATLGMGAVQAQESPWMVRARVANLGMHVKDGTPLALGVNDKTIPEVDISYFFNKNVAAELILTIPQKQTVTASGAAIGTFKHLPPTLLAQYHFTDVAGFKPYVGAGVNFTDISSVNLLDGDATLDGHSWGGALQVGLDIPLDKKWSLNFDIKKVYIKTHVYAGGASVGTLKLDPVVSSVGLGYRF